MNDKFEIKNQKNSLSRLKKDLKAKNYELRSSYTVLRGTESDVYSIWAHKDTSQGVLTITTFSGVNLIYRLQMVKMEEL